MRARERCGSIGRLWTFGRVIAVSFSLSLSLSLFILVFWMERKEGGLERDVDVIFFFALVDTVQRGLVADPAAPPTVAGKSLSSYFLYP